MNINAVLPCTASHPVTVSPRLSMSPQCDTTTYLRIVLVLGQVQHGAAETEIGKDGQDDLEVPVEVYVKPVVLAKRVQDYRACERSAHGAKVVVVGGP